MKEHKKTTLHLQKYTPDVEVADLENSKGGVKAVKLLAMALPRPLIYLP